jgi:hypothetical protein
LGVPASPSVFGVFSWALIAQGRFAIRRALIAQGRFAIRPQMPSLRFAMDAFHFLFVRTPALTGRQMAGSTRRPPSGRTCASRWC